MTHHSSDRVLREVVALADQRRRARGAVAVLVRAAPIAALIVLVGALAARIAGWSAWAPLGLLIALALGLSAYTWLTCRRRETSDAIAAAVDADATLSGELRSAHWFEGTGVKDEWSRFHVDRATEHARAVDWAALYPRVRGGRSWAVTAVLVAAAVVLSVGVPGRRLASASGGPGEPGAARSAAELLSLELQKKLTALMVQMEEGKLDAEQIKASLAELKDLMAKIDPAMQKKLEELLKNRPPGADAKGEKANFNDGLDKANSQAGMPEDVRWALEDLASRLANGEKDRQTNPNNPSASSETGETAVGSAQAKMEQAGASEMSVKMVREAASDPGAAKMMAGGGMMGGDSRSGAGGNKGAETGAAEALLVAQALRKELVEAAADTQGENVNKEDIRRKTEQGKSALGFTRVAPATFERSRADAPPPVPEARRPLVQRYFIRK